MVADGCPGSRTEHDSGKKWPRAKWYALWHFYIAVPWAGARVLVALSLRDLTSVILKVCDKNRGQACDGSRSRVWGVEKLKPV